MGRGSIDIKLDSEKAARINNINSLKATGGRMDGASGNCWVLMVQESRTQLLLKLLEILEIQPKPTAAEMNVRARSHAWQCPQFPTTS